MSTGSIARLKITLDDVKPIVMRQWECRLRSNSTDCTSPFKPQWVGPTAIFTQYARAKHPGETRIRKLEHLDARKTRLIDVLEDVGTKTLKYLYDFGDGWEHTVKIEPDP